MSSLLWPSLPPVLFPTVANFVLAIVYILSSVVALDSFVLIQLLRYWEQPTPAVFQTWRLGFSSLLNIIELVL
ncbi:hypothetical protein RSOLAG22IIIB_08939 [Rhizoctonia solani]|uniref:Uncharacterized protein n=1 Tax=Rhizoctonia solani TaxID=456999 RepID=A0A0K6FWH2_9AGAM|nr:hypothetical protein RSOLAG22IIIB_08939 [Rhizoctonia solani]